MSARQTLIKKPAANQRDKWNLRPFRTCEGCVEIWLFDEVYSVNIHLLTECKGPAYTAWIKRVFDITNSTPPGEHLAAQAIRITGSNDDHTRAVVIVFPGKWEPSLENFLTLSHECYHSTSYALFSRGLKHTDETEESFAYFHESITRRLSIALGKRPLPYRARQ